MSENALTTSEPSPLQQADYDAIQNAVMETARGRWFLTEYARRNRSADTDSVLGSIAKLEKIMVRERSTGASINRIRYDLADMAAAIKKTKEEIHEIQADSDKDLGRFEQATSELDAIVTQTESATSDILEAAEKIQEIAWTFREQKIEEAKCDELDIAATNIYMACSFQDLTGQRISKIVHALHYIEKRVDRMVDIWDLEAETEEPEIEVSANEVELDTDKSDPDELVASGGGNPLDERPDAHLLNGPCMEGDGNDQSAVDDMFSNVTIDENVTDVFDSIVLDEDDFDKIEVSSDEGEESPALELDAETNSDAITVDDLDPVDTELSAEETRETEESNNEPVVFAESNPDDTAQSMGNVIDEDLLDKEFENQDVFESNSNNDKSALKADAISTGNSLQEVDDDEEDTHKSAIGDDMSLSDRITLFS
ncbi:MAG: protein phosphatase CheZ [Cohaesibacteraceae bacterium]|nr:protein phosphatase CheZ [Cohaesibacteraceae bacterium]MBL4876765.1 protein phosphatase CheZ [Cohaesibacteraceae bacterium]